MRTVSLADAKAHLSELLNSVESGEEIIITRHGRPVARVSPTEKVKEALPLQRLAALRAAMPKWGQPSVEILRQIRDAE